MDQMIELYAYQRIAELTESSAQPSALDTHWETPYGDTLISSYRSDDGTDWLYMDDGELVSLGATVVFNGAQVICTDACYR